MVLIAESTANADRHGAVTLAVAALAFSTVPLELGLGKIGLGAPLVLAFLVLWGRYRHLPGSRGGSVPILVAALLIWSIARLTVIQLIDGQEIPWSMVVRESLTLLGCLAAYSLARRPALWTAIFRGVAICLVLVLAQEAYQLVVGLPTLRAAGYGPDLGYFFFTEFGDYRPFGTFAGPTLFGTFVAMVGLWVAFSIRRPAWMIFVGAITVGAVLATETRAAFIGIALALLAMALISRTVRQRLAPALIFGPLVLVAAILYKPTLFAGPWERLLSATDVTDTSRSTRLDLWAGVVDAVSERGATLAGLGPADWERTMYPQVGEIVFYLGHAHSNFFQEWYRYGIIGALIFAALCVALVAFGFRGVTTGAPLAAGGLAAALVFLADSAFNNSLSNANYLLMVFLLIGTAADAASSVGSRASPYDRQLEHVDHGLGVPDSRG